MWTRGTIIAILTVFLSGCADFSNTSRTYHGIGNSHCAAIMRSLHVSDSRYRTTTNHKILPTERARLIKQWQYYGCDRDFKLVS